VQSVVIVLLNWNGLRDTLDCLESLYSMVDLHFTVVVVDNLSSDGSFEGIRSWAKARGAAVSRRTSGGSDDLNGYFGFSFEEYSLLESRNGPRGNADLHLIQSGSNLGFAGGNNVGIRFLLKSSGCRYVWLLNNDTVVEKNALVELLRRAGEPDAPKMIGSTLCFHQANDTVQAHGGGTFSLRNAMSSHVGEYSRRETISKEEREEIESRLDYVVGASMFVSRDFLENVGLMQEDYFLYFEELDWVERARRVYGGFRLGYAPDSIVFHRVGASAGTGRSSLGSLRYLTRSRLRFVKRFYPKWLFWARLNVLWDGMKAFAKGRNSESLLLVRGAFQGVDV
jgi:GT2 family glycosyltransferase